MEKFEYQEIENYENKKNYILNAIQRENGGVLPIGYDNDMFVSALIKIIEYLENNYKTTITVEDIPDAKTFTRQKEEQSITSFVLNRVLKNVKSVNFRDIDKSVIKDVNIIVIDVSFISIESIVKKIKECFKTKKIEVVSLIKPQFECGKDIAKKYKGVIKNKIIHKEIIDRVISYWVNCGFNVKGLTISPIKGGDGNIEYLLYTTTENVESVKYSVQDLVENAFCGSN